MTKADKRVAVAKDVLKQIKLRKIIATPGIYSEFTLKENVDSGSDAQAVLTSDNFINCQACALGSLLISKARLYDDLTMWQVDAVPYSYLEDLFGNAQMGAIERSFERCGTTTTRAFGDRYPDSEARLVAIMRNIVRNKGTFKPSAR